MLQAKIAKYFMLDFHQFIHERVWNPSTVFQNLPYLSLVCFLRSICFAKAFSPGNEKTPIFTAVSCNSTNKIGRIAAIISK